MATTSKATWIWFPGDFEVWLGNVFNNRRTERGAMFPPFWKQDAHWPTVEFSRSFSLAKEETITIAAEGRFNWMIDGRLQFGMPTTVKVPAGEHQLNFKVWNQATPPALFIEGETIRTDGTWLATYEDKIWIDENGVAHGSGTYVPAATWHFDSADTPPSQYQLLREERRPVGEHDGLYDFGRETFGYLKFRGLTGDGTLHIYYGESPEEAMDKAHCETLDLLHCQGGRLVGDALGSKAFRYVHIEREGTADFSELLMDYEYAPLPSRSGRFRCSDELLNRIWDVSAYTLELTTREFFLDGIKRDRWTWSGDAIQSYLMNYYLHFDADCVKRTIRQLRGKDPVTAHVNTIMDYTFYWFKSVLDYYKYTGDIDFVCEIYPRMVTLMGYVLSRTNDDMMAEGLEDDWIFVDWVDFPMHKRGSLCFEQILMFKSWETIATCAELLLRYHEKGGIRTVNEPTLMPDELSHNVQFYRSLAGQLRRNIKKTFWDDEQQAYLHAIEDGEMNRQITKFPNMFAILYGMADADERQSIMQRVMLNPDVEPITTPYMRFYELETLCQMGLTEQVLKEVRDYWGGMLSEGATSFWEKYNPHERGNQHLAMYGRLYGKSLCHAWGAAPIYLFGKYYLGVRPTAPGYATFEVRPSLGDLDWMEGDVPTPNGLIHVYMDRQQVRVTTTEGEGWLCVGEQRVRVVPEQETVLNL